MRHFILQSMSAIYSQKLFEIPSPVAIASTQQTSCRLKNNITKLNAKHVTVKVKVKEKTKPFCSKLVSIAFRVEKYGLNLLNPMKVGPTIDVKGIFGDFGLAGFPPAYRPGSRLCLSRRSC